MTKINKDDLINLTSIELDEVLELSFMELGNIHDIKINNTLLDPKFRDKDAFTENFIAFMRNPDYLHFFCQYILNVNLLPFQLAILQQLWTKPFPMLIATRGGSKSYMLAVYICCRAVLDQGSKICVVGAALRQSLILFNYIQNIWDAAPILQDICGGTRNKPKRELHMCTWKVGSSEVKFLPLGNGETIRGQRATVVINDEFSSTNPTVFETVVRGFAAVKSQGLLQTVSYEARKDILKDLGLDYIKEDGLNLNRIQTSTNLGCNQIVIAGTTSFQFNHFYKYYKYYKAIIESGGDREFLRKNYPDMIISSDVDVSDYSIIRIPYDLVPAGMMDKAILAQGRATMDSGVFDQEYGCIFPSDSDGFYPASLLFSCTSPIMINNAQYIFGAKLHGNFEKRYVMGIDPASESDNFAINILEMDGYNRKIVYQWSTNRKRYQEWKEKGLVSADIDDYITFCVKHIRSLLRRFNILYIIMDAAGGGVSIKEGLKDKSKLVEGDQLIYDPEDENDEGKVGKFILKMINFQDTEWRRTSHHGLKKDFNDRRLLFPKFDTVEIAESGLYESENLSYENLEECYLEIEELRYETILIKHDQTATGIERWDVPKLMITGADEIKKKLKKDRFTSLLLANWGCRFIEQEEGNATNYELIGRKKESLKPYNVGDTAAIQYIGAGAKKLRQLREDEIPTSYMTCRRN